MWNFQLFVLRLYQPGHSIFHIYCYSSQFDVFVSCQTGGRRRPYTNRRKLNTSSPSVIPLLRKTFGQGDIDEVVDSAVAGCLPIAQLTSFAGSLMKPLSDQHDSLRSSIVCLCRSFFAGRLPMLPVCFSCLCCVDSGGAARSVA